MSTAVSPSSRPSTEQIDAELARRSLAGFIKAAWPVVQVDPLQWSWHLDVVCEYLEACTRREVRQLIINVPPRTMKSRAVSVMWPAWSWLTDPTTRWLFASYAADLAVEHAVESREVIESRGGRERGGTLLERAGYQGLLRLLGANWHLSTDQNVKSKYKNTAGGSRQSTSVTAKATGFGGDFVIADDPLNATDAESEVERAKVLRWWDQTMSSRFSNPKTGVRVVVMQRLHEEDLTGHLLAKEAGYEHLCLPMEHEPSHPFRWPDDPRTQAGELLWAERMGPPEIAQFKLDQGPYGYAGQYQQRPSPEEGGILKRAWWRYYPPELLDDDEWGGPRFQRLWQSWDTALKEKTTSDFTVGTLWAQDLANIYLLRRVRGRFGLTEAIEQVRQLTAWAAGRVPWCAAHEIRVENAANGPEVVAALRKQIPGLRLITADRDKVVRAHAITPRLAAGNVHVPGAMSAELTGPDPTRTPAWVQELIDECAGFPNGSFDDQVDSVTQALDPRHEIGRRRRQRDRGQTVTGGLSLSDV
ncbi:MAG: phage terminase large subunit [Longimicrobiaceae bacterium]